MNKPTWASAYYRNPHLLVLTIVAFSIAGLSALYALPRLEDPRITNRNPIIITTVPGASAERVETLVTEPLETALQEIGAIQDIESTSTSGVSLVAIELKANITAAENKEIFSEIRDKVNEAEAQFPPGTGSPLIDDKRDPVAFSQITAVRWTANSSPNLTIMNRVAEDLANRLRTVDGTELVRLYGAPDEEMLVTVAPEKLADLGIDAFDLSQQLGSADAKQAAGTLRGHASNVLIEVHGELNTSQRIGQVPLRVSRNQSIVRVSDVATVERRWREPSREVGLVDGDRVIYVAARMDSDRRIDQWANEVNNLLSEYSAQLGDGLVLDNVFAQERYTMNQLGNLAGNLLAGALVVIAVIFITMGWRLALIVGSALPIVTGVVLFGLQMTGNAIHQMSIFGMIIALGLLIDNAIVVADEVMSHKMTGKSALEAVERAVRHLFVPLLASTLTTILAFAPIMLLPGSAGDFVGSIGSSVIMAIAASFLVAITITSALAGHFAKPSTAAGKSAWWQVGIRSKKWGHRYKRALTRAFQRPLVAILVALFLPASGFIAATQLGSEFFPPVDRDMFEVQVWLPNNASIDQTRRDAEAIESAIRSFDATRRVYWLVGGSFPTVYYNLVMGKDNAAYYAQAIVTAASSAKAKAMIGPLQDHLDQQFPQAQIVVGQFGQGPPLSADVEYRIYGPSLEKLQRIGEEVRLALQADADVLHTQATIPAGEPKLWFKANEDETHLAGMDLVELASQLQTNLEGSVHGSVLENLERLPVRVRYDNATRSNLSDIASMQFVSNGANDWVSMHAIGELELRPELGGITRFNAQRTNRIRGFTHNDALPIDVTHRVLDQLYANGFALPAGYRLELGGAVEQDAEATGNLLNYVPLLITLTVATLILLFRSAALAGVLGLVGALSVGLGMLATWFMGFPISFNTILGTLGLAGLAFNNSIVVIAAIRANPRAKAGEIHALVDAVTNTSRHILSTTLTTIGGFLPLLVFTGGDFWPSLAIVLAGGVGGSMILALLFVPAVYQLMHTGGTQPAQPHVTDQEVIA